MEIITKLIITGIIIVMFIVCAFFGWRVLNLMERVGQLQDDRNKTLEELNKLRMEKIILSLLEKKMILVSLSMTQYNEAINDPSTKHEVRKIYRELKEKFRENIND